MVSASPMNNTPIAFNVFLSRQLQKQSFINRKQNFSLTMSSAPMVLAPVWKWATLQCCLPPLFENEQQSNGVGLPVWKWATLKKCLRCLKMSNTPMLFCLHCLKMSNNLMVFASMFENEQPSKNASAVWKWATLLCFKPAASTDRFIYEKHHFSSKWATLQWF